MLYETQRNNGKLGDYLVGVASGKLYDAKKIGRKYINKAMRVIRTFIASTKGFVVEKIKWAAEKLTNLLLRPDPLGNSLGAVTTFFNEHINYLGCAMASLEDRLSEFLEEFQGFGFTKERESLFGYFTVKHVNRFSWSVVTFFLPILR